MLREVAHTSTHLHSTRSESPDQRPWGGSSRLRRPGADREICSIGAPTSTKGQTVRRGDCVPARRRHCGPKAWRFERHRAWQAGALGWVRLDAKRTEKRGRGAHPAARRWLGFHQILQHVLEASLAGGGCSSAAPFRCFEFPRPVFCRLAAGAVRSFLESVPR